MSSWKYDKLSNICSKIGDGLHGTPKYVMNSDIYFINGNNLKNGWIEISKNTKCVSDKELASNYIPLDKNTLLLSINGTLGNMAFYRNEKVILGKSSAYLNFKTGINKFYYYYFQLPSVQQYFFNVATGSTIKNLSLKSIQDFFVPVPEYHEWNSIASILSSLDAKIELNNRINTELEAMAKALYDYWFVQFDFPDDRGLPYRSSGGRMVWNEELKREVPEGWEVSTFGSYCPSTSGYAFKSSWWVEEGISVAKIKDIKDDYTIDLFNMSKVDIKNKNIDSKFKAEAGDVLIAMTGATVGKYAIVPITDFPIFVNQRVGFFSLGEKPILKLPFLVNSMNQSYFRNAIYTLANGAAQPNISNEQINNIPLLMPEERKIKTYNSITSSFYEKILINQSQNRQLSSLRDWLLPMLMNGQVRVV
jgi:type I restriction enzyme S subunit